MRDSLLLCGEHRLRDASVRFYSAVTDVSNRNLVLLNGDVPPAAMIDGIPEVIDSLLSIHCFNGTARIICNRDVI